MFKATAFPLLLLTAGACRLPAEEVSSTPPSSAPPELLEGTSVDLPAPNPEGDVTNYPVVTGWPEDVTPSVPEGFELVEMARSLDYPRQVLVLENGDLLVAEAKSSFALGGDTPPEKTRGKAMTKTQGTSANRISLLRDDDGDGEYAHLGFARTGLNQPFGMAYTDGKLYVANTDGLVRFDFEPGQTAIEGEPEKLMSLPAGGYNNHWTRNLQLSKDEKTLFVSVGSASNVADHGMKEEEGRAAIHAYALATGEDHIFASGLRNPVGMDLAEDGTLWAAVNERDRLGDRLVPDYVVGVKEGGFYGWPYSYYGQNVDPRRAGEAPDMVQKALVPDMAVGAHVAALGFLFADETFPEGWREGAFVARHGSWNRSKLAGYDVVFLPFEDGRPTGEVRPFMGGFVGDREGQLVYGRPVSLRRAPGGGIIVVDDAGGRLWRVRASSSGLAAR